MRYADPVADREVRRLQVEVLRWQTFGRESARVVAELRAELARHQIDVARGRVRGPAFPVSGEAGPCCEHADAQHSVDGCDGLAQESHGEWVGCPCDRRGSGGAPH